MSVVLLWDSDNKRRFPCNSGVFQRGVIISDTEKGFPAIREMFCSFFPPKPFFKNTLGLSFSLVFFCSVFPFNIPCFSSSDNILVLFLWLYLCCPFRFFVSASFLPTSFLPSPFPIHLAFIFGRFALPFFLFAWYCFQAWHFPFSLVGFCLVFFWLLLSPFFSSLGILIFVFLSVVFLLSQCGVGCFGFRLMA